MSPSIRPVATRADLDAFIRLPTRLYGSDPRFVPPLMRDRRTFLDPRRSAFFKHGEAQYFLAERDGRAVGRISAQIDHAAPAETFSGVGLFGCLDAEDDPDLIAALIGTAEDWLARKGVKVARGPCLLSMNGEAGLLVEGQAEPSMVMVPWHPEYLGPHIEAAGYGKARDLYYYKIVDVPGQTEATLRRIDLSRRRGGLVARRLDPRHAAREMELIRTVYNDAWQHNWGFVPLVPEDLAGFRRDLRLFLEPEGGIVVEVGGETAGVALLMPNIAEVTRDLGPEPSPFGWSKLLFRALGSRYKSARIILFGVKARFADSMLGVAIAMTLIDEVRRSALRLKLDYMEAGWVLENNTAVIGILNQFQATRIRTLRLYERNIGAPFVAWGP